MIRSLTVKVAGQTLTLKTDADPTYVESLARFVTAKIDEAKKSTRTVATQNLVLLTALNIADDLFQQRREESLLRKNVQARSKRILELLDKEDKL